MSGTTNVSSRALLAKLTISLWSARTTSPEANAVVAKTYGSGEGHTRVTKALIDPTALEGVRGVAANARKHFYENTAPWADEGKRALLARKFGEFDQQITGFRSNFQMERDSFITEYPRHIADAQRNMGTLFVQTEYPSQDELAEKFSFEINYEPMNAPDDWRVSLSAEETSRLVAEAEARQGELLATAQSDVVGRAYAAVNHMAERLAAFNPDGETRAERKVFYDTLVTNVASLAAALPGLNIGGNPEIDAMAAEIAAKLTQHPADVLRTSSNAREGVIADAVEIAEKMKGFL